MNGEKLTRHFGQGPHPRPSRQVGTGFSQGRGVTFQPGEPYVQTALRRKARFIVRHTPLPWEACPDVSGGPGVRLRFKQFLPKRPLCQIAEYIPF
jgi:hypothetical protein